MYDVYNHYTGKTWFTVRYKWVACLIAHLCNADYGPHNANYTPEQ